MLAVVQKAYQWSQLGPFETSPQRQVLLNKLPSTPSMRKVDEGEKKKTEKNVVYSGH